VFAAIGREVLRYLEVPPRDVEPVQLVATAASGARPPSSRASAERASGARPPSARALALESSGRASAREAASPIMPDVRGRSLRRALAMLAALRAEVELDGSGLVVAQAPAAGAPVAAGDPIHLTLARPAAAAAPLAITKLGGTE
jgi:hypothetical protein